MNKTMLQIITFFLLSGLTCFAQVYVAVDGNDDNPGSIDKPFATIHKAIQSIENAGDTIFVRGGVYNLFNPIKPTFSGEPDNYNRIFAYQGERPALDFSTQPFNSNAKGIMISADYWHIKGFEILGAGDNGIHISGDSNKVEKCIIHHCRDTGIQISDGGSYNIIINCDSYLNFDSGNKGENADGFAAKLEIGPGNEFHGCRAWSNSDDGWDLYEGSNTVLIDSCWAFNNGRNIWNISGFAGDGNGFKLGGNYVPAQHFVTNSVSFDNVSKGFDQNHNTSGVTIFNCTAWRNNRNFAFGEIPKNGIKNVFKNNLSYLGNNSIESTAIAESNSWQGFSVSLDDFVTLDTSLAKVARLNNGKLPYTGLLKLKDGSQLIDAGVDVGIAYTGSAPDLGAFETGSATLISDENFAAPASVLLLQNYPNPFNPITTIEYSIQYDDYIRLVVYDLLGNEIDILFNEYQNAGSYSFIFDGSACASGIYLYKLIAGRHSVSGKMTLLK
ncbi:MAG: right-handed parallel beta-helix repeat-containing protein [Melioribacteraceae bacterium]|nr:right-handed parallel beta-helix repeat-containing protein [Melioribacteraceae bacterium]